MAEKRDYYEVLGIQKGASADEIKSAYKKAALKWHPDRWVSGTDAEKKNAEDKFKEASEAYSILNDPDKRAKYDQFGFAGVDGAGAQDWSQGFGDLNDILRNVFGGAFSGFGGFGGFGGGSRSDGPMRHAGRDIHTTLKLTLEEIATGCDRDLQLRRNQPCPDCGGRGTRNASDVKTCPTCHGRGQVQQVMNSLFGQRVAVSVCPQCGGTGQIVTNPCRTCGGHGVTLKTEQVHVHIPAGVEDGTTLVLRGEGHCGDHNGTRGNLQVTVQEIPHPSFKREGINLFYTKTISIVDAILGCDIDIPCLDGGQKLRVEPGTQSGTVLRMRGKGLPQQNGYGSKGDLYVKIFVWTPRRLDRRAREAIESLAGNQSVTPDPSREDRALFEKESKYY